MNQDNAKKPAAISPDDPQFRFVQMQQPSETHSTDDDIIDKASFLNISAPPARLHAQEQQQEEEEDTQTTLWAPTEIRTVPAFYPLEKSSRLVEDDTPSQVAARISECLRRLSIQATYENSTATLFSAEHVEMHLSLWKTPEGSPQQGIVVELQRRNGDSLAFHRYSRSILDAAMGLVDTSELEQQDTMYSKKVQRLLAKVTPEQDEHDIAIQAIEIAHGLLMKDRMDARVLGLESLCLLTDPQKAGIITSVLTAHVVILGSTASVDIAGVPKDDFPDEGPFQEIQQSILNLVQFSRIQDEDFMDDPTTTPEDITNETDEGHLKLLHNLALAVLANALDCIENPDRFELEDTKPRSRLRTASSTDVANEFLQSDILANLIQELGKAGNTPHNAVLSAKCIGSLCRASKDARKRAKELGAKQVIHTALDVGVRTHLKLETEVKKVQTVLEQREEEDS